MLSFRLTPESGIGVYAAYSVAKLPGCRRGCGCNMTAAATPHILRSSRPYYGWQRDDGVMARLPD